MKSLFALCALSFAFALPAAAQNAAQTKPRAVIELFTSQGCSSCPAADKLMTEMAKDVSLIVLTLPVDYWDYLGWKDTLAHSTFTNRQKTYAAMRSDRQVYTPQAIVNGAAHAVGSERSSIDKAVLKTKEQGDILSVDLAIEKASTGMRVKIAGSTAQGAAGHLWVLPLVSERSVKIGRGENSGRSLTYTNVVRGLTRIASWNGEAVTIDIPAASIPADAEGFVVLLQGGTDKKASQVLGAVRHMGL
jgi:hypothetical protein